MSSLSHYTSPRRFSNCFTPMLLFFTRILERILSICLFHFSPPLLSVFYHNRVMVSTPLPLSSVKGQSLGFTPTPLGIPPALLMAHARSKRRCCPSTSVSKNGATAPPHPQAGPEHCPHPRSMISRLRLVNVKFANAMFYLPTLISCSSTFSAPEQTEIEQFVQSGRDLSPSAQRSSPRQRR